METYPKDYIDTLDSDNLLEFNNSMDFEESLNYYVYDNSKDSKDAPKIVTDYEESEENKVTLNNTKVLKN